MINGGRDHEIQKFHRPAEDVSFESEGHDLQRSVDETAHKDTSVHSEGPVLPKTDQSPLLQAAKKHDEAQFRKFLDVFKKLHINIPFIEALEHMSSYVKFMNDILSKKIRLGEFETIALTEECNTILQQKLTPKLKLGLGEVKRTSVTLQLADISITYPSIIGDVLGKVDKFIFGRIW
ncbi:hypothetical protein MLD38_034319 [Melastoma candidum]|uniref:Uncharacterized protein n=1 Tax=Melastoma candidum TaxID=119954 RepID=A0ACB9MA68_9MYRT|nr:hypothetical protein MLD38_034319 [Melastoma candidum]